MQKDRPNLLRNVLLGISVLSFCFFAYQLFQIITQSQSIIDEAKVKTLNEAKDAVQIVEGRFQSMVRLASSTTQELSEGKMKYQEINDKVGNKVLENSKDAHNTSIGLVVAFEPNVYFDSARYAPYFRAPEGKVYVSYIDRVYDYTQKNLPNTYTDWYTFPLEKGACWTDPHFGRAGDALFTGYQLPFFYTKNDTLANSLKKDKDGKRITGVVCADYRLDQIWQEVSRLGSGKTSFGFLITPSGKVVSYPRREYLGAEIKDLKLTAEEARCLLIYQRILRTILQN